MGLQFILAFFFPTTTLLRIQEAGNSRTDLPFEAFLTAAGFYLALTFVLVALFHRAERRWLAHLR